MAGQHEQPERLTLTASLTTGVAREPYRAFGLAAAHSPAHFVIFYVTEV
jgi:hypothetical protein